MTRVKVCGITRPEDAELAVELGAWAIGFILWPRIQARGRPRRRGRDLHALRRRVERVGVFVNAGLDEIAQAAEALTLSPRPAPRRRGAGVLRRGRAADRHQGDQGDPRRERRRLRQDVERYHTDFHLLDTAERGNYGGTGETWDWALAVAARARRR